MKNWETFWQKAPTKFDQQDFFRQVGKTVAGKAISEDKFERIMKSVWENLAIEKSDTVLDLCCGNGLITSRIAPLCHSIIGVDYSQPLIDVAKKYHERENTTYLNDSILNLSQECFSSIARFSKIYMYEALQHFSFDDFQKILKIAKDVGQPGVKFFLGSVPDKGRIWDFYDSPERKAEYHRSVAEGTEAIGTWWIPQQIEKAVLDEGFSIKWIQQDPSLHTAHYRFDFLLEYQICAA